LSSGTRWHDDFVRTLSSSDFVKSSDWAVNLFKLTCSNDICDIDPFKLVLPHRDETRTGINAMLVPLQHTLVSPLSVVHEFSFVSIMMHHQGNAPCLTSNDDTSKVSHPRSSRRTQRSYLEIY
jgi:hypothetical protein